jgi:membrane protease YdiL (CAAX protease family)
MIMGINQNTKRILIFFGFAFGIPWAAALVISQSAMMENNPVQAGTIANTIFISTPWLANIVTRLITKEGWKDLWLRPNFKRGWRFYLAVWLLPLLAIAVGGALFFLLVPQSFDPNLGGVMKLVESTPSAATINPWLILMSMTLSMMFISVPINTVASLGEEFGWRAYLLPKMVERFGAVRSVDAEQKGVSAEVSVISGGYTPAAARKAALLTGLIHGLWHWPLILLTASLSQGVTVFTLLAYLLFTCTLSVLLSWSTLRSGSVWPASLGHGAVNATSAIPGYLVNGPVNPLFGPDPVGLIGGIGYTLIALVLLFSRKAFAGEKRQVQNG